MLKGLIVKFLKFIQTPLAKFIVLTALLLGTIFIDDLSSRAGIAVTIFILYYIQTQIKLQGVPWAQGKKPKFQDGFTGGLKNWDTRGGNCEIETNFGNPAPDVLLKQVGNPSATPQTFLLLKDISISRPSVIECDVYIQPRGIFNLVFGITEQGSSYFMARLDSRDTEFDALLFKPNNEGWNFLSRSDKYRTTFKIWHRVKIEIPSSRKANFYKNGDLILARELEQSAFGQIGIMNEEADVHVDNIVITEL